MVNTFGNYVETHEPTAIAQCKNAEEVLALSIMEIGIDVRVAEQLWRVNIRTVRQLVLMSDIGLLAIRSIGPDVLSHIKERLRIVGVSLRDGAPFVDESVLQSFIATQDTYYRPTSAVPGSSEKLDIMKERVRAGLPLWHVYDKSDYEGLTAAIKPRDRD